MCVCNILMTQTELSSFSSLFVAFAMRCSRSLLRSKMLRQASVYDKKHSLQQHWIPKFQIFPLLLAYKAMC